MIQGDIESKDDLDVFDIEVIDENGALVAMVLENITYEKNTNNVLIIDCDIKTAGYYRFRIYGDTILGSGNMYYYTSWLIE